MANVIKSDKTIEKEELKQNKKIKPHLQKFVIDLQRKKAEETAREKKVEDDAMLGAQDIIERSSQLSAIALFKDKLWKDYPPTLEMAWTNKAEYEESEVNVDVSGFAFYLVREYRNFLREVNSEHGYPNPMVEQNLPFFWNKMNADMKLLIAGEKLRVAKGNKSKIISYANPKPDPVSDIILPGNKKWTN